MITGYTSNFLRNLADEAGIPKTLDSDSLAGIKTHQYCTYNQTTKMRATTLTLILIWPNGALVVNNSRRISKVVSLLKLAGNAMRQAGGGKSRIGSYPNKTMEANQQ